MSYLVDANILSEMTKPAPDAKVVGWFAGSLLPPEARQPWTAGSLLPL